MPRYILFGDWIAQSLENKYEVRDETGHLTAYGRPAYSSLETRHRNPAAGFGMKSFQQLASTAERAKMDFLFIADVIGMRDGPIDLLERSAQLISVAEPLTLMPALLATTDKIGLVVTASMTYSHPYAVARQMASLDLISCGRGDWDIVTSTQNSKAASSALKRHLIILNVTREQPSS